jgi:hypothetical protein
MIMEIMIVDEMSFGKQSWVCSICGQGLTRKSTAVRHNNNLHFGAAVLVRPYDYIIGRLNGEFLQSDPSFYRRNKRTLKDVSGSIYHQDRVIPESIVQGSGYGNGRQQPAESSNIKTSFYPESEPRLQTSHKPDDVKSPNTLEKLSERTLKLTEFKKLVKKNYAPQDANQIIMTAAMQASLGDDDFLEKNLTFLRNIDRANS